MLALLFVTSFCKAKELLQLISGDVDGRIVDVDSDLAEVGCSYLNQRCKGKLAKVKKRRVVGFLGVSFSLPDLEESKHLEPTKKGTKIISICCHGQQVLLVSSGENFLVLITGALEEHL